MRFFIRMGLIGSTVRSWSVLPLAGILAFMGLVVPAQIVHADICALCEDRPHVCSPKTLASCRSDKSDKSSDRTRSSENSDGRDRSPCGSNPPDTGSVYYSGTGALRADPSAGSAAVGEPPRGSRLRYDRMSGSGGARWYHVQTPDGGSGWVPSSDVACTRPTVPLPPKPTPQQSKDADVPSLGTCAAAQTAGSRTFGSEECQR
jgi:hypothetical protein